MFKALKSLSLRQISIAITLMVVLINVTLFVIFNYYLSFDSSTYRLIAFSVVLLGASFLIIRFILEYFVFRKIKLIYRLINKESSSVVKKEIWDFNVTSLDEIQDDVKKFTASTREEIKSLKTLEDYRKIFVGNISHELKTPIFSIQGYLHTLLEGGMYEEKILKKYLKRAISNVERLELITRDLEVIYKLESDREELKFERLDLKLLVQEVMEDLDVLSSEKQINLLFKEGSNSQYFISGNKESLKRVFSNLISNSIKYGVENGFTKVAFYDLEDKVLVEVSDNGIGIKKEHLNHVFDRFYRVDNNRSRKEGGSGLGLSIVKHIVEAHGSKISVRSVENKGSTFSFTLKKLK